MIKDFSFTMNKNIELSRVENDVEKPSTARTHVNPFNCIFLLICLVPSRVVCPCLASSPVFVQPTENKNYFNR